MTPGFDISAHDALKRGTAERHARVEERVNLPARLRSLELYRDWLQQLLGIVEPAEHLLDQHRWPDALKAESRRTAPLLRDDLAALGLDPASIDAIPRSNGVPRSPSRAAALGWLYVLEGQTLGGRVILRQAERRLGVDGTRAARFLAGYGDRTGAMWRALLGVIADELTTEAAIEEAVAAACACFDLFEGWMMEPGARPELHRSA